MAVYPCSFGEHRYPQKQRSVYISDLAGSRPETRKHRICPRHLDEVLQLARERMTFIEEDSQTNPDCEACGGQKSGGVFLKIFDETADDPAQYAVDVCAECRQQVLEDLRWRKSLPVGS